MDGRASCKTCLHEAPRRLDLIVTDGHDGLLAAVLQLFSATPRQRCLLRHPAQRHECCPQAGAPGHCDRTAGHLGPTRQAGGLDALGREHSPSTPRCIPRRCAAWPRKKTRRSPFTTFPKRCIATSGRPTPSRVSQSNVRQRTDQIDVFTTEMSCLIILWATIQGITLRKVPVG